LQDEFALEFCPLSPCLAKNSKMTALTHVDDMTIFGGRGYVLNPLLAKGETEVQHHGETR
jgi:hypothetical protein